MTVLDPWAAASARADEHAAEVMHQPVKHRPVREVHSALQPGERREFVDNQWRTLHEDEESGEMVEKRNKPRERLRKLPPALSLSVSDTDGSYESFCRQDVVDTQRLGAFDGKYDRVDASDGGLGGATVAAAAVDGRTLRGWLGGELSERLEAQWGELEAYRGLACDQEGGLVCAGLQLGNVFLGVQPLLGVEGDPMRLLFERDLTPHPQYCAYYEWLWKRAADGGVGADAVVHMGMHGTVEWLPGSPLGGTALTWPDRLLGGAPNVYLYAMNNPSESILAKRRGYGTLVSYNVPPYARAGLYAGLSQLPQYARFMLGGECDGVDALLAAHFAALLPGAPTCFGVATRLRAGGSTCSMLI